MASQYAGFWMRFAAYLIDAIIFGVVLGIISVILSLNEGAYNLLSTVLGWLYFALMESSSKQGTLGKMILGITVTNADGGRISFLRATGRYFSKIISALILLIGYIMVAFTERKQGLHDMICSTLVVRK